METSDSWSNSTAYEHDKENMRPFQSSRSHASSAFSLLGQDGLEVVLELHQRLLKALAAFLYLAIYWHAARVTIGDSGLCRCCGVVVPLRDVRPALFAPLVC